jgi:PAS domain-containing protein
LGNGAALGYTGRGVSDSPPDELERLRAVEQRHRLMVSNMSAAFALYELQLDDAGAVVDARVLEVNPAFERMLNVKPGAVVGRTLREVLPFMDPRRLAWLGEVNRSGEPRSVLDYVPAMDQHVEVRAYRADVGQVAVQIFDVTEAKQAEQQMLERDARLDALVSSAMDAIVSLDEAQRIVLFNPAAEKMFRLGAEQALGKEFDELIAPQHRSQQREQLLSPASAWWASYAACARVARSFRSRPRFRSASCRRSACSR